MIQSQKNCLYMTSLLDPRETGRDAVGRLGLFCLFWRYYSHTPSFHLWKDGFYLDEAIWRSLSVFTTITVETSYDSLKRTSRIKLVFAVLDALLNIHLLF